MSSIQILGLEEIIKNNGILIKKAKEETIRLLDKAALDTESRAKLLCPVDTGRLRASIQADDEEEFSRVVSTDVEYALWVEVGTGRSRAQPYMRPVFEVVAPQFHSACEQLARRVSGR